MKQKYINFLKKKINEINDMKLRVSLLFILNSADINEEILKSAIVSYYREEFVNKYGEI